VHLVVGAYSCAKVSRLCTADGQRNLWTDDTVLQKPIAKASELTVEVVDDFSERYSSRSHLVLAAGERPRQGRDPHDGHRAPTLRPASSPGCGAATWVAVSAARLSRGRWRSRSRLAAARWAPHRHHARRGRHDICEEDCDGAFGRLLRHGAASSQRTSYTRTGSETPFSSRSPRSSNETPAEVRARSRTVPETSVSPAAASPATRDAMFTAPP